MGAAKKKKSITLIILILLATVLIIAYFLLVNNNKEKAAEENTIEDTIILSSVKIEDVIRIDYNNGAGTTSYEKKDGKWQNKEDIKEEIDQTTIDGKLNEIGEIKALRLVTEEPENLGEFGLDNPSVTINAALKDGSSVSIMLGSAVPGDSGYYACLTGEEKVYVVNASLYQAFIE